MSPLKCISRHNKFILNLRSEWAHIHWLNQKLGLFQRQKAEWKKMLKNKFVFSDCVKPRVEHADESPCAYFFNKADNFFFSVTEISLSIPLPWPPLSFYFPLSLFYLLFYIQSNSSPFSRLAFTLTKQAIEPEITGRGKPIASGFTQKTIVIYA